MSDPVEMPAPTAQRLRLTPGETNPRRTYTLPDPDSPGLHDAAHAARSGEPTRSQLYELAAVAEAYLHLTTYSLGQEHCARKLRDVWRARRARQKEGEVRRG